MKLLLFLLISINCYSQAVSISEGVAFDNVTVTPIIPVEYQGAVKFSTGMAFNLQVICPLTCAGTLDVLGSVDNINYEVVAQLTQAFVAPQNYLYNVFNMRFLYYKIRVTNTGTDDFIVNAYRAEKSQI